MTMSAGKVSLILGCLLALSACEGLAQRAGAPAGDPVAPGSVAQDYGPLLARAREAGRIRVVVRLATPFVAEGLLSPEAAAEQQGRISRLQKELAAALGEYGVTGIRGAKYTPFMAMEVDPAALRALISHPLVASIEADAPIPPTAGERGNP